MSLSSSTKYSSPVVKIVPCCNCFVFNLDGTKNIALTPSLAAQCGYSMESDPWGNTRIYTSLLACYVDNKVS